MKHWIGFTNKKSKKYCYKKNEFIKLDKPQHVIGLGSFANIKFDQRYSLDNIIKHCFEYLEKHKIDNFDGFIVYGSEWLKESNKLYEFKK